LIFFALQAYAPFESKDFEYSYRFDLPIILKSIPVVIYNGNFDLVVDFYGTTEMLDTMIWPGKSGFNSASTTPLPLSFSLPLSATLAHRTTRTTHSNTHGPYTENGTWIVDGKVAGSVRSSNGLTYLIVNNAGTAPRPCSCSS
jgi:carboxypeptidase C (cathepsin A)